MQYFPVNEVFKSIQGEGYFVGKPALFVRFQGCDVGCKYCDTKYAQVVGIKNHVENIFKKSKSDSNYAIIDSDKLIASIKLLMPLNNVNSMNHIVLTGGEPFSLPIETFINVLMSEGYFVQVETSGCKRIPEKCSAFITLSPKKECLESSFKSANEVKIIITDDTDFEILKKINCQKVYLQPESCRSDMIKKAIEKAMQLNHYVSLQIHKYAKIR